VNNGPISKLPKKAKARLVVLLAMSEQPSIEF